MVQRGIEPKHGAFVGRVVVPVYVENAEDRSRVERGEIGETEVRRLTVDALVDTGASFFCLSEPLVKRLGLPFDRQRPTKTPLGVISMPVYRGALIEVQGRSCAVEVMGLPENRQCLLGQIALEQLDWWVDTLGQRLVGNPEHGGEWMAEL